MDSVAAYGTVSFKDFDTTVPFGLIKPISDFYFCGHKNYLFLNDTMVLHCKEILISIEFSLPDLLLPLAKRGTLWARVGDDNNERRRQVAFHSFRGFVKTPYLT